MNRWAWYNDARMASPKAKLQEGCVEGGCRVPPTFEEAHAGGYQADVPRKLSDITWRVFRIMAEIVEGFEFLSKSSKEVSFFGSARFQADNPWYEEARTLGNMLGKAGFTVITGGGPGIMEAGNRGAYEAGAPSLGLNIQLPQEQRINPYVTRSRAFHYFFTRKVMLAAAAQAYVFFPGGFGTLDEAMELITLVQTKKMRQLPILLVGAEFWGPFIQWVEKSMVKTYKTVSAEETEVYQLVDSAQEAYDIIAASPDRSFF